MTKTNKLVVLGLVVLGSAALSATRVAARGVGTLLVPVADLKYAPVPNMTGVQMATVEGDPAKGAGHFFIKFTSGFKAPLHHHTSNHSATVVGGTLVLTVAGKETKLPPGSFFALTDKTPHETVCETGSECILSVETHGKWDVVMEKQAAK